MNNLLSTLTGIAITLSLISCSSKERSQNNAADSTDAAVQKDSVVHGAVLPEGDAEGDFNGDGTLDVATVRLVKEGEIQSKPWIYTIVFTDTNISPFSFASETPNYELINEGSLNAFPGDELTVVTHASTMGTRYLQPYTFNAGVWGNAMEQITLWGLSTLPDSLGLDGAVFKRNDDVFFYLYSEDDEEYHETEAQLYAEIKKAAEVAQ